MRKKILSVALSFSMIFSMTGFAFADANLNNPPAEPTKPNVENYYDNDKIEKYNNEAKEYNKKADEYNAAIDKEYEQAVKDINEANAKEKERVDQVNAEKQEAYEKEMAQYEKDKAQYEKDKAYEEQILADPRYDSIEQFNEVVKDYNNRVDTYNGQVSQINKAYGITDEIANNSPQRNTNAPKVKAEDTYTIIEAENKSGRMIPVHIEHIFPGTDIKYVLDFKIDANDTIILRGIAPSTDCPVKGTCYFFYNTDENHILGMWANSYSTLYTNTTATKSQDWENGDTHTITYANSTNEYLQQFDDISITYEYQWIRLYQQKEHFALANTPIEPTLPTLDLETFVGLSYPDKRAYLTSLSLMGLLSIPKATKTIQPNELSPILIVSASENKTAKTIQTKQIKNTNPPKTSRYMNGWALINLITVLLNLLITIILLITAWFNKRKENDTLKINNKMLGRIISIIVAIGASIIFLITEDMTLPMIFIDQWTLLMLLILVVQFSIMILCKSTKKEMK